MAFTIPLEPSDEAYADLLSAVSRGLAAAYVRASAERGFAFRELSAALDTDEAGALAILHGEEVPSLKQVSDACVALGLTSLWDLAPSR